MKIVSFKICPFVQRVIAVLELKEITYDVEYISLADKPDWFAEVSPHGQVPVLIEDAGALFESGPIAEYIDEAYGAFRLHPAEPFVTARHRAWIELASKNYLVQCSAQRSPTAADLDTNSAKLSMAVSKIEAVLGEATYFAGSSPCLVDATWFVLLHRAHIIEQCTGFDFFAAFPKTKRWQAALLDLEALNKSAPAGFKEEFVNFYLNENTYLGGLMKRGKGQCGAADNAACDSDTVTACCR
jgi:glutathione S-transferase